MKNLNLLAIGTGALIIGFLAAWLIKPSSNVLDSAANSSHSHEVNGVSDQGNQIDEETIWTCSMDPQVRQNEPGACPICGMDLIPLESMSQSDNPLVLQMTENAVKMANIQTTIVGSSSGTDENEIKLTGKIKADETTAASIVSHIPGRIEKLYVSFTGEEVYHRQKVATVYSPELITAQKEMLEAKKIEELSPGLLEAAKNKLRFWKIDENTISSIVETNQVLEYFDIFAEHSGVVTKRKVSVGDYIRIGEVLFDVQNLYKLWVVLDIYEEDIAKVRTGQRILFTTPAVPNKIFSTTINFIDPVINPNTRVGMIRAEVNNADGKLKPEMFVTATIRRKSTSSQGMMIPKTAVLWTGKKSVVYVKQMDEIIPSFEFREIELGERVGQNYFVESGIEEGEEVVTNGAFVIDASAQLNNQSSMMNRNVQLKGNMEQEIEPDFTASTPPAFKAQLGEVLNRYLAVKDALILTDGDLASTEAKKYVDALKNVDMSLLKGDAHMYWMEKLTGLNVHGKKIVELKDVEEQRKQFDFLSQLMIKTVKAFGTTGTHYFVQHCPMANKNAGADWISAIEKIQNPYFGDKMMTCGFVSDTL